MIAENLLHIQRQTEKKLKKLEITKSKRNLHVFAMSAKPKIQPLKHA